MENCGAKMEWRIGKNLILAFGQFHFKKVLFANLNIFAFSDVFAEFFGGFVVWLHGNYLFAATRKRGGDYARSGTDIQYYVALFNIAVANQKAGEFWSAQEMLRKLVFTHLAKAPSGAPPHTLR